MEQRSEEKFQERKIFHVCTPYRPVAHSWMFWCRQKQQENQWTQTNLKCLQRKVLTSILAPAILWKTSVKMHWSGFECIHLCNVRRAYFQPICAARPIISTKSFWRRANLCWYLGFFLSIQTLKWEVSLSFLPFGNVSLESWEDRKVLQDSWHED